MFYLACAVVFISLFISTYRYYFFHSLYFYCYLLRVISHTNVVRYFLLLIFLDGPYLCYNYDNKVAIIKM